MISAKRATRSRYSSPAQQQPQQNGKGSSNETPKDDKNGSRSLMEKWLEPSVQNKTSFEQAGLVRYGVLGNMAPLGAMPKAGKKQDKENAANGSSSNAVRKIILRPSGKGQKETEATAGAAESGTSTPSDESPAPKTPATETPPVADAPAPKTTSPHAKTRKRTASVSAAATADTSATTGMGASTRRQGRKSLPAHVVFVNYGQDEASGDGDYEPGKSSGRPMGQPAAPKRGRPPSSMRRNSIVSSSAKLPSPVKTRPSTPPGQTSTPVASWQRRDPFGPRFVKQVIDKAVAEAVAHHRYPTAWALRTAYEERVIEPGFVSMLEQIFTQTADASTVKMFNRMVEKRKRRAARDKLGRDFFVTPGERGDAGAGSGGEHQDAADQDQDHQPKPAPYAKLIHRTRTPATNSPSSAAAGHENDGDMRATKKIKITHHRRSESGAGPAKPAAGADGAAAAAAGAPAMSPPAPATATASSSPAKCKDTVRVKVKTPSSSRKRARRGSTSSGSTLSPIEFPWTPELPEDSDLATPAPPSPSLRGASNKAKAKNARSKASASASATATANAADTGPSQSDAAAATAAPAPTTTRRKSSTAPKSNQQAADPSPPVITLRQARAAASAAASNASPAEPRHHRSTRAAAALQSTGDEGNAMADDDFPARSGTPAGASSRVTPQGDTKDAKGAKAGTKAAPKDTEAAKDDDELDASWNRRREARKVTDAQIATVSSVRDEDEAVATTPARSTRKTRQSLQPARATRSASKRATGTPGAADLPGPDNRFASPSGFSTSAQDDSVAGSRAVTPTGLRPSKKQKTGLRVKSSPVKKKGGTAAGVPRANDALPFPAGPKEPTDNDEYCSACGNAGDVVCCDGCPRSFHFECVDMDPAEDLPDEWFCSECLVKRHPARVEVRRGVFGPALNALDKSIHRAFSLPRRVQHRFEGVRVGADGDYEEVPPPKAKRRTHGYEEAHDFFKQREDGEAVLCHGCQAPSSEARAIIPCSACPLYWHIDCLDPPLAVPPVLKTWKCPAHADDLLLEAPPLAPAHRFRKVKGQRAITPALWRGLRNNGHIELDWGSEPEDAPEDKSGWRDVSSFGRTYKVSAKGVRLDFIEQLRKQGAGYAPRKDETRRAEPYLTPPVEDHAHQQQQLHKQGQQGQPTTDRSVDEMQASLVLASLATAKPQNDKMEALTSAVLAAADPAIISMIAQADAGNVSRNQLADHDEAGLRAMLAHMDSLSSTIRGMLGESAAAGGSASGSHLPSSPGLPAPVEDKGQRVAGAKDQLVTEPTPPSTIDHEGVMECD